MEYTDKFFFHLLSGFPHNHTLLLFSSKLFGHPPADILIANLSQLFSVPFRLNQDKWIYIKETKTKVNNDVGYFMQWKFISLLIFKIYVNLRILYPICLHGVALHRLSTGTTLPLRYREISSEQAVN